MEAQIDGGTGTQAKCRTSNYRILELGLLHPELAELLSNKRLFRYKLQQHLMNVEHYARTMHLAMGLPTHLLSRPLPIAVQQVAVSQLMAATFAAYASQERVSC